MVEISVRSQTLGVRRSEIFALSPYLPGVGGAAEAVYLYRDLVAVVHP
jgi:hypothetical protein